MEIIFHLLTLSMIRKRFYLSSKAVLKGKIKWNSEENQENKTILMDKKVT